MSLLPVQRTRSLRSLALLAAPLALLNGAAPGEGVSAAATTGSRGSFFVVVPSGDRGPAAFGCMDREGDGLCREVRAAPSRPRP